jgi:hypothetical protein
MGTRAGPNDAVDAGVGATEIVGAGNAMSGGTDATNGPGAAVRATESMRAGFDATKGIGGSAGTLSVDAGVGATAAVGAANASTATAATNMERARRPAIPHRSWAKRCGHERTALTAKTKVPAPVFVVVFNMLSWSVRPLAGCRESALPPGADRGLEAGTVNSIRRVGTLFWLPPIRCEDSVW